MEEEAEDMLRSFQLTETKQKSYMMVRDKFGCFLWKGETVYKRCRFNLRCQEEGESAPLFITDVYALAEHCDYGDLRDELIWDRLVVGVRDSKLPERLQLDADLDLTLDNAVTIIWQLETVHWQQVFLHGDDTRQIPIDVVKTLRRPVKSMSDTCQGSGQFKQTKCSRCAKSPNHDIEVHVCPSKDIICRKCGRRGTSSVSVGRRKSRP